MKNSICALLLLPILMLFQNCSPAIHQTQDGGDPSLSAATSAEFSYPYASKPDFYGEVAMFQTASKNAGTFQSFQLIAGMRYLGDLSADLQYEITIQTPDGKTLCPQGSGVLYRGQSAVQLSCLTAVASDQAHVTLTLISGAKRTSVKMTFPVTRS